MSEIILNGRYGCMEVLDLGKEYRKKHPDEETHYKCQCLCGRICYFNKKTLESKPRYCCYPIKTTYKREYRKEAVEATIRKRQKYQELENVILRSGPFKESEEYCYRYIGARRARSKREERYALKRFSQLHRW